MMDKLNFNYNGSGYKKLSTRKENNLLKESLEKALSHLSFIGESVILGKSYFEVVREIERMEALSGASKCKLKRMRKKARKMSTSTPRTYEDCFREIITKEQNNSIRNRKENI